MILLDTHIWIKWANHAGELTAEEAAFLQKSKHGGLGISAISCWEVSMLHAKGRISFSKSIDDWMEDALNSPGILLIPLTLQISIESTRLPGEFHGDPADRIIVATANDRKLKLVTRDGNIRAYANVALAM